MKVGERWLCLKHDINVESAPVTVHPKVLMNGLGSLTTNLYWQGSCNGLAGSPCSPFNQWSRQKRYMQS
ncbi:uncharacterized protein PHALS_13606 [Plasmopara halstedii]|uniref:Uncharacterized protein n=1 Tax=Plasmopara halstedii TaxID=4781 RepID=A0A0P1AQJ6_PLAHL|nr:uncharacterized protein PHALS_13606 [Plasmopara halstedii]CEG43409.1 hypothetical protein PHALS_13606 [Plasmopara halstedii]|eukprot:XP_024579778.1 hypothetical protein PHALS_13606 [Plasmopara halstedii]